MDVLMVSGEYPPADRGGLGRYVRELSRALVTVGHRVGVVGVAEAAAQQGRTVSGFDDGTIRIYGSVDEALSDGPWQATHAHDWVVAPVLARLIAERGGAAAGADRVPHVVATIHADVDRFTGAGPQREAERRKREAELVAASHVLYAPGRELAAVLSNRYPHVPVRLAPGGVHAEAFAPRNELGDDPGDHPDRGRGPATVVFHGRLVPYKGCQDLLEALALLHERGRSDPADPTDPADPSPPLPHLRVVGDGYLRPELEQRAEALGIGRHVTFTGHLRGAAHTRELHAATVVALPSHHEPFGLTGLEAMAAGAPVIAGDTGGFAEYIEPGRSGLLVPPRDPVALADAIEQLLHDPALARELARNAVAEVVPRYTWEATREAVLEGYCGA